MIDPKDIANLSKTLAFYAEATGKDLVDVVNRAGRQTAIFTTAKTPKADPAKIDAALRQQVATQVFGKSGRRLKRAKAVYQRTTLADRIVRARARKEGRDLTEEEAEEAARKMIRGRKRAIGFIRSGWIPALRAFGARGGKLLGKPKGSAVLAQPKRIIATLTNNVQGRNGGAAVKRGTAALRQAVREVDADMRRYAEKKINERTAKANAAR